MIEKTDDEPGLGHNDSVNTEGPLRDRGECLPLDAREADDGGTKTPSVRARLRHIRQYYRELECQFRPS